MRGLAVAAVLCVLAGSSVVSGPPAAAAPVAEQFGVYNWNVDLTGYNPAAGDVLNWGAGLVAGTGVRTIRVYLGANDVYRLGYGAASLAGIAQHPAYSRLFGDSRFDTYLLTTYSAADMASVWQDGFSAAEAAAERAEIESLGRYLVGAYPSKRFVILNWEGDNAVGGSAGDDRAWSGYASWIAARAAGVHAVGSAQLLSGLEFNRVAGCGVSRRCVVTDVAPTADVDLFSYSSWESTQPGATLRLKADLDTALAAIRRGHPSAGPSDVLLGEFGVAREIPNVGECQAASTFRSIAEVARTWGVRYAIFWQIVDNTPDAGLWWNFGLRKYDGTPTLVHVELNRLLTGQPPGTPSCPAINQGGVVNGIDFTSHIRPGDPISIFGPRFSPSGNVVHVQANGRRYRIAAGSRDWFESPTQINARLPTGISGNIVVYVTNASAADSNGQVVTLAST